MYSDNLLDLKQEFMEYVPARIVNYSETLQNLYMDNCALCDDTYLLKLPSGETKDVAIIDELKNYMCKDTTGLEYILTYNKNQQLKMTTISLMPIVQSG